MKLRTILDYSWIVVLLSIAGCASYTTPGGPVDLAGIQAPDIRELLAREPAAEFPASISFARVQSPDYASRSADTFGSGSYSVVTTREFMLDSQIEALSEWPEVRGVAPLSRLLLPGRLNSLDDLRVSSARLKSDILFVFTIDTSFRVDGKSIGPLSVVSLGLLRDRETVVTTTASAIFVDVKTGYVYGAAEATANEIKQTSAWGSASAIDQSRLVTEKAAFASLTGESLKTWTNIVSEYSHDIASTD
jgi:hypothetical protein